MTNSYFYKSYWHVQALSSKDWLSLKSEAALNDIKISLLTKNKSNSAGLCLAYSETFSNHYSLVNRFNQITNKKMTLLMVQKGNTLFPAFYGIDSNNHLPLIELIQNSSSTIQRTLDQILYPMYSIPFFMLTFLQKKN